MLNIILKKDEHIRIQNGHPWVFSNEIERFEGIIKSGEIVDVYSSNHVFVGRGFLNTSSKIMVRILTYEQEEINRDFYKRRIIEAWEYRKKIGMTEACRVIFAEADRIPGFIVDRYGEYLSVQILALGIEIIKDMLFDLLVEVFNPIGIMERSDVLVRKKEGLELRKGIVYGNFEHLITIKENEILMQVDLLNGQKTGYFLDQQSNRAALKPYVKDAYVLDCFSHTGGFALHAAAYGAKEVIAVDISKKATDDINKNILINNFKNMKTETADIFEYLRNIPTDHLFDVIILDPPAFTKSKETIQKAYAGYKEINIQAMKKIKKGGFLMTCSCSQHMTPDLFLKMLLEAANDAKRFVQMVEFRIQSKDHPMLMSNDETLYLKCTILHLL